jgi:uncharacterized membrane protein (UPF0127 family)
VEVARSRRERLVGLALRRAAPDGGLLIPQCRSVHTFGMRFAIDLVWLGPAGEVVRADLAVRPRRVRSCRAAVAVVEVAAGEARGMIRAMAEQTTSPEEARGRMRAALDPRRRLYRDRFNEYFVFVLSATGAAFVVPLLLYAAMAITDLWHWLVFVAACVALELMLIFGVGRPQMKPVERVGWALLWGATTAGLALCFYYLVAKPTL